MECLKNFNNMDIKLNLYGYRFKFDYAPSDKINFFIIRGLLGKLLKRYFCIKKDDCEGCILKNSCAYSVIFEPEITGKEGMKIKDIPRPFIIHNIEKNKKLNIEIIIIGDMNKYLPYFIFAFTKLRDENFLSLELDSVETFKGETIYKKEEGTLKDRNGMIEINNEEIKSKKIILEILTPMRIKEKGHYTKNLQFETIIKALLRRIKLLQKFYDPENLIEFDTKKIVDNSKKNILFFNMSKWIDWGRYSKKQDFYMKLGGIVGEIGYEGDFEDFSKILRIGEFVHIGKNCSFGLGRYLIKGG